MICLHASVYLLATTQVCSVVYFCKLLQAATGCTKLFFRGLVTLVMSSHGFCHLPRHARPGLGKLNTKPPIQLRSGGEAISLSLVQPWTGELVIHFSLQYVNLFNFIHVEHIGKLCYTRILIRRSLTTLKTFFWNHILEGPSLKQIVESVSEHQSLQALA